MKTKLPISSFVFLFSIISNGMPLDKTVPFRKTLCQMGDTKASFLLRFDKKINASENDYSGAPMVFLKSKKAHIIEPLTKPYPGDFSFVPAKENSTCIETQGFELNNNVMAILYSKDNRPFQELYQVAVWNTKTDKIIDKRDLGAVTEYFKTENGFAFSTMIPRSDADEFKMTSSSGREMTAIDKDLGALQTATLDKNKLKIEYDPKLSYERSNWKKFFKNQEEYLNTAGWDSKKKNFKNIVVYKASYPDRKEKDTLESCIAFTEKRDREFDRSKWKCLNEKSSN